jgi:photoactive yellow protein
MKQPMAFDSTGLLPGLAAASKSELDELEFGVIEMDLKGIVLRYNHFESQQAGLSEAQVVGRQFFWEVAVCCNNQMIAQRFEQPSLDETIEYTFSFQMRLTPVTLRLLKDAGAVVMYMLVRRS